MKKAFLTLSLFMVTPLSSHSSPASTQELMSTWIAIESQRGHLQESWKDRKASLKNKIKLLNIEKNSIQEIAESNTKESSRADKERQSLLQKQSILEQEQKRLEVAINQAISSLSGIVDRLPPPVTTEWRKHLNNLNSGDLSLSEKLESSLNLLKISDEFNQRIAFHKGPLLIEQTDRNSNQDEQVIVNQVYLGLSQGWFVSDDGSYFGYGKAEPNGWRWWFDESATAKLGVTFTADQVLETLEVLQNPSEAKYVTLPITSHSN